MIDITCSKSELCSALSVTTRTVAVKSPVPAMEGIFIRAEENLSLTGYNNETGITVTVDADIRSGGETVFPSRLFFEIARKLPEERVNIRVDDRGTASIRSGISHFHIKEISAQDYPELPVVIGERGINVPRQQLREMINGTLFSVSENQARPVQTGCLFEIDSDSITVVAVDGYRLSRRSCNLENSGVKSMKFVVPGAALREVEKILADGEDTALILPGDKHIRFCIGNATLVCRILEGDFIDWRRVIPKISPITLTANVLAMQQSIERVSLMISERVKSPVRCHFSVNTASFETVTTEGSALDSCDIAGDGHELDIGFNSRFILEALRAVPTEEVVLQFNNPLSPLLLLPPDNSNDYTYMILPVRLNSGN